MDEIFAGMFSKNKQLLSSGNLSRYSVIAISIILWSTLGWYSITFSIPETQFGILFLGLSITTYCFFEINDFIDTAEEFYWRKDLRILGIGTIGIISIPLTLYSTYIYDEMLNARISVRPLSHYVLAIIIVCILFYLGYDAYGKIFPTALVITIIYAFFGEYMPSLFFHAGFSIQRILELAVVNPSGAFGFITVAGAVLVAPFLLVSGLILSLGGLNIILEASTKINNYFATGAAQSAVIISMLVGSINGSSAANTSFTGSFTIPMMKESGIRKETAASIESIASSGGQILPPIMGVSAFLMADLLDRHLSVILLAAVLPALIFYFIIVLATHNITRAELRESTSKSRVKNNRGIKKTQIIKNQNNTDQASYSPNMPHYLFSIFFLFTLAYLVYLLGIERQPVINAGLKAAYLMIGAGFLLIIIDQMYDYQWVNNIKVENHTMPCFKHVFKTGLSKIFDGLLQGARTSSKIMIVAALVGMIIRLVISTGLPSMLSLLMVEIAGGSLLILLVLTMILSIILGMGLPTVAAYIIVAVILAPTLVNHGISELNAHFFVLYFGVLSNITPPVALTIIIASSIANSNFLKTCLTTLKLSLPMFMLPFAFIYHPNILITNNPIQSILTTLYVGIILSLITYVLTVRINDKISNVDYKYLILGKVLVVVTLTLILLNGFP